MEDVVIVDAARSAVGRKKGSLGYVHPSDTLGPIMMKMLERNKVASDQVDQIVGGCINKLGAQGMNITRTAWLLSLIHIPSPRDATLSRMPSSA